jgi:hypothetical protein
MSDDPLRDERYWCPSCTRYVSAGTVRPDGHHEYCTRDADGYDVVIRCWTQAELISEKDRKDRTL